ncbi:MAG: outer membrane lipoprotein carrier protein LolA [Bryobacteraceae bacterium]
MTRTVFAAILTLPLLAADPALTKLLNKVEVRYNGAKTLQVAFEESFTGSGPMRKAESGELFLRKPGRMRWEYKKPSGKLFVSDGKNIFYFNPASNRGERVSLKESEDLRTPLAFLLGKLDFEKDFGNIFAKEVTPDTVITAQPKSDRLPYKRVEFTVSTQQEIRKLMIMGHDDSVLTFDFWNERMNPPLDEKLFQFQLPPGATWVEGAGQ